MKQSSHLQLPGARGTKSALIILCHTLSGHSFRKFSLQECALNDERVRLQQHYNECNYCIHGGPEAAAAAG